MKAGREAEEICAIGSLPPTRWAHIPLFLWVEHELGRSYHISRLLRTSCAQRGCPGDLQYVRMLTTTSRWRANAVRTQCESVLLSRMSDRDRSRI